MLVLTGSELAWWSLLRVILYRHTIFSLSIFSDSVRHLRELWSLPYGHPKTGTNT